MGNYYLKNGFFLGIKAFLYIKSIRNLKYQKEKKKKRNTLLKNKILKSEDQP